MKYNNANSADAKRHAADMQRYAWKYIAMKNKCYACAKPRSLTVEHIIPQAIGGRLKARLYCKECNGTFGEALDDEISKQFGWVGTILNIKRERGKVQPYEVTDVKSGTKLLCDGKKLNRKDPIVKVISKDGMKLDSADVTARTEEELKKICNSIQGRYNVPGGIKTFQDESPGPTDTEHIMMIDNSLLRRAVSKIAYGFLCIKLPKNVVFSSSFDSVRLYIKEPNNIDLASANYRNTGFMTDYVRPIHKIHVAFHRGQGILIGFVLIFGYKGRSCINALLCKTVPQLPQIQIFRPAAFRPCADLPKNL